MGVATAGEGRVTVTDMDRIETSNLNRQFLFRIKDVGQFKSEVGACLRFYCRSLLRLTLTECVWLAVGCSRGDRHEQRHARRRSGSLAALLLLLSNH